jgi:thiol:disulfide interchange protein
MQPIVNGLEAEFREELVFEYQDATTPEGRAIMEAFGIRGHPTILVVAPDGTRLWVATGSMDAATLRTQIERLTIDSQ